MTLFGRSAGRKGIGMIEKVPAVDAARGGYYSRNTSGNDLDVVVSIRTDGIGGLYIVDESGVILAEGSADKPGDIALLTRWVGDFLGADE